MPKQRLTARQMLTIALSVWTCIWVGTLAIFGFSWHSVPADKFHHFVVQEAPLMIVTMICVPIVTLLPIAQRARKERDSQNTNGPSD